MRIVLMRHGIAIDREHPECPEESERFLTSQGETRAHKAALGLRALDVQPDLVLSSPWLRARQTAEICLKVLDRSRGRDRQSLQIREDMLPESDPGTLVAYLQSLEDVDEVLIVGHAPHLDRLLAHLLGAPGTVLSSLKKAGAASVAGGVSGFGQLEWMLPPRALREIGRARS